MNLCFTYESCNTRKSFTLFITVKTISKLNAKDSDEYEIKILKFSRRGSRSPDNTEVQWSFHVVFFAEDGKKCTKIQKARARPLFCSLNLLFGDVPVAVAVVVS